MMENEGTMTVEQITGRCLSMCPEKEQLMREREGLLHKYEIDEGTKYMKRPKADPMKIVKCFSRSAAGQIMTDPNLLRPPHVLLSTVRYLFTKLRSIRQDAVIQRVDIVSNIFLLEPIVRFHIYATQRLCERDITEFNAKINNKHLFECIKQLLVLYDQQNENVTDNITVHKDFEKLALNNSQSEMEAIYILLHIGDCEALKRALSLSSDLKKSPAIQLATKISLAWYLRNYVYVRHLVEQLPPILACAFFCNLQSFRRNVLQIMSSGYNSRVLTFPGLKLQELLFYKDISKIQADCNLFGLTFTNENILFKKSRFNEQILLANPEMYYTSTTLHKFMPKILLECTSNDEC
ncbi:PREDICTED: germinal-center associated nuclear protein isoform X2 [Trachymyrmex septentrionalis]|uniref:germinal-center associated nuclear protein isoform X2 n=1 Tax=Trachymyrmex septentrionalis TaxID=34720 RepID=UPI00084F20F0|nr:PREDICTED: germinal-center associated nuclear protein isoform X2 [Trachymyrmex septentrionalis]